MRIQYNLSLDTYTAVDKYGVVLAIYDPATHGSVDQFAAYAGSLTVEG